VAEGRDLSGQKAYWQSIFAEEIPVLDMPLDYPRPQEQSHRGALVMRELTTEQGAGIRRLAGETGSTEYMVFVSAVMALLGRYARQEDVVIGSPYSGRVHRDTESMLGMFVNTLAIRGRPEREKRYEQLLQEVKEHCLQAQENQEYPFEELVEAVSVVRDFSRNPLFDVMLVVQNNEQANVSLSGVEVEAVGSEHRIAKFDMTFTITEMANGGYALGLEYCSDLYKESSAARVLEAYIRVLEQVISNKELKVKDIKLVSENEREQILRVFNDTAAEYPKAKTVVELFEEQVVRTPNKTAVVFEEERLTHQAEMTVWVY